MEGRPYVGIGVLIANEKKEVLLGKRIDAHGHATWGPPGGGHLEFSESFEQGAYREVKEETGLEISNPLFIGLTNDIFHSEKKHYISVFLSASFPFTPLVQNLEPHKVQGWEWFDLSSLSSPLFLPLHHFLTCQGYGIIPWAEEEKL